MPRKRETGAPATPRFRIDFGTAKTIFDVDADFLAERYRVFISRDSDDCTYFYERPGAPEREMGAAANKDDLLARTEVLTHPDRYIEVPLPKHADLHGWFRDWLTSEGRASEYFGSIGGWFKEHAKEGDKLLWDDYRWERVIAHVEKHIGRSIETT